jgi:hypothetical protein
VLPTRRASVPQEKEKSLSIYQIALALPNYNLWKSFTHPKLAILLFLFVALMRPASQPHFQMGNALSVILVVPELQKSLETAMVCTS